MVRQAAPMNDLFRTTAEVQSFCDRQGWLRVTRDVDLTLLTGSGS